MRLREKNLIWGILIHLSYNMWSDRRPHDSYVKGSPIGEDCYYRPYLRFDEALWDELLERMAGAGINMVVLDVGDAVRYESHPEISVKRAWSAKRLRRELDRMRGMGIEPIPKLNFSTCHDAWMGEYARCVSTPVYYRVCRDLIREVAQLFEGPRFFHLGMDEENAPLQGLYEYLCCRQFELWWHDLRFLLGEVEAAGSRPWIWSDYAWGKGAAPAPRRAPQRLHKEYARTLDHKELFFERMPKSVLQSNWYYGMDFKCDRPEIPLFKELSRRGYEQVPTGSNFGGTDNFGALVNHVESVVGRKGIRGYLQTPWYPTLPAFRDIHLAAIDGVGRVARATW